MCENIYVFQEEICTLVQGILLALAPTDGNIFEFQGGKPNFVALVCRFCTSLSVSPADFFFFRINIKFLEILLLPFRNNIS